MSKLLDMFKQVQRSQSGSGIGFLGKSKAESKPRAAALVVEFSGSNAAQIEAVVKAGADGLLFTWDGQDINALEALKKNIESAKGSNENLVSGLHITGSWDSFTRERFEQLKEYGVNYIILPLNAPARLLALHSKDVDLAVTVPMREGDMYPIFIHNLTALEAISAVHLDFGLGGNISAMSIEDIIQYRAVREAVRFPAFINVKGNLSESDAYTISTLGIQAVILQATGAEDSTEQVKHIRQLLEKIYQDEKEKEKASKLSL